jgi:hypothetical protein
MRTFRSRWSNGLLWVVEIRKLLASHSSCDITDHSERRLALAVERFGRKRPDRLEFIRREFERGARELSHEEFRNRLSHLLAEQFADETLESLVVSPDLSTPFPAITPGDSSAVVPHTSPFWLRLVESHRTQPTIVSPSLYCGCGMSANQMDVERLPVFASFFLRKLAALSPTVSLRSTPRSAWNCTSMIQR